MVNRRQLLRNTMGIGAAAFLASGPTFPARAQARGKDTIPLSVGVGGITFAYLPLFAARAAGFLEEEGVDVTFVNANGGANALAAMLGGSVDICGLVMSDILLAATKRQRIQAFAPLMSQYASDAVVSTAAAERAGIRPDMAIEERMARLKGMTLAISSRGSGIDKLWRYLIGMGHLDPDRDVTLTVVKLDQMYPALISGQIDGFNTTAPANIRAVEEGKAVWVARPSQGEVPGLENFLYTVLAARPDYLAQKPEAVDRLMRGLERGAALVHSDPAKVGELLHAEFFAQTDRALVENTVRDQMTTVATPPEMTPRQFEQNIEFMKRFGHPVDDLRYEDIVNASWLRA